MEKKVRISFDHSKFTMWYRELEDHVQQLQKVLDKYADKGIIKKSDIIPELVKSLFRQDFTLLLEVVRERGLQGAKSVSYAMERVISKEVHEMEAEVKRDLSFLNAAQMLSDWSEKTAFVSAKDGSAFVDVEALREHLTKYMIVDDETKAIIDRVRKLWQELKQLDSDLQTASIDRGAIVRVIGNGYEANALISVTDSDNVMFDELVLSGINGNVSNPDEAMQPQGGWIVRELEI